MAPPLEKCRLVNTMLAVLLVFSTASGLAAARIVRPASQVQFRNGKVLVDARNVDVTVEVCIPPSTPATPGHTLQITVHHP